MNQLIAQRYSEIYHYGVKGQKWGVRRYQNEDGTLTDAGKERYYTSSEQSEMYEQSKKNVIPRPGLGRTAHIIDGVDDIADAGRFLRKQAEVVSDNFNTYCDSYNRDIGNMKTDPKFMSYAKKRLDDEFGKPSNIDDDELFDLVVHEIMWDYIPDNPSRATQDAYKKFDDSVTQYYSNIKSIAEDIVGSYGDRPVTSISSTTYEKVGEGLFSRTVAKTNTTDVNYKDVVENTIANLSSAYGVRYMNNHTEAAYLEAANWPALSKAVKEEWGYRK